MTKIRRSHILYIPSEEWAMGELISRKVVLGMVVTPVARASIPVNMKLLLSDAVAQPVVSKVP